jgi:protein TonB
VLQREIQALLAGNESIRGKGDYAVVVSISLSPDGQIGEARLLSGSNSADLDEALRRALSTGLRLTQRPPDDLPQPIRLRISSRS